MHASSQFDHSQIKIHANGTLVVPAIDIGTSGEYTINVFNADSTSIVPSDSESITIVVGTSHIQGKNLEI